MKNTVFFFILLFLFQSAICQSWINFSKNDRISTSLIDNNYLWIGSGHGLAHYNIDMDTFYIYNACNSGLLENTVTAIALDNSNKLYVATLNEGLVTFHDGIWEEVVSVNEYLSEEYFMNYINDIYLDQNNAIWISATNGLIKIIDGEFLFFNPNNSNIPGTSYTSIIIDENKLWLTGNGFTSYDSLNWEIYTHENYNLPLGQYSDMEMDNNGNIWCTTSRFLVKNNDGVFNSTESIVDGSFYSITILPNNCIYAGMQSGDYAFQKFENNLFTAYNSSNCGITNKNVSVVDHDEIGNTYFAGNKGLDILKFDGEWSFRKISNSELPDNHVVDIAIDKTGKYAICTRYGIIEYNWQGWSDVIDLDFISKITYDNLGNLIMATPQEIYIFNGSDIQTIQTPYYGYYPEYGVNDIIVDSNNNIWMTFPNDIEYNTYGGIFKYNGTEWTTYTMENSGLPYFEVRDIHLDQNNNLWFCTPAGLAMFDNENWEVYNTSNTILPTSNIYAITQDNEYNFWISTNENIIASMINNNWNIYENPYIKLKYLNFDSNGNLWGLSGDNLIRYDMDTWQIFDETNSPLPHNNRICMQLDQNDNISIGTNINGLYIFNENGIDPIVNLSEIESSCNSKRIICPNPCKGKIKVELSDFSKSENLELILYNMNGQKIYNNQITYQKYLSIDLQNYLTGAYILRIKSNDKNYFEKLIIQ